MTFVFIHSLKPLTGGAQLLGLAHLSGGVTRVYTVGWFAISFGWILLLGRSSISDVVLDLGIYIKKLCWVFFPTRVS